MPAVQHQQHPKTIDSRRDSSQSQSHQDSSVQSTHSPSKMANTSNNGAQAAAPAPPATRKGKGKKNTDPVDTNKLLEQTMARLERDVAGDKEQEAEIGAYPGTEDVRG
jgi:hypothetical protein